MVKTESRKDHQNSIMKRALMIKLHDLKTQVKLEFNIMDKQQTRFDQLIKEWFILEEELEKINNNVDQKLNNQNHEKEPPDKINDFGSLKVTENDKMDKIRNKYPLEYQNQEVQP